MAFGDTQILSEAQLSEILALVRDGKLWIRLTKWGEKGDKYLIKAFPQGQLVWSQGGNCAFFRPVEQSDIEYVLKHNEIGNNWGYTYCRNYFLYKNGKGFKRWET